MNDTRLSEIADGIHQLTTYLPEIDFSLNQYLITGDEPMLFHTGIDGSRLGQVCVTVRQTTGTGTRSTRSGASTAGPDNYRVGGLPAGDYRVEFRDCGGRGLATEWYDDRPTMRSAVVVTLTASASAATAIDAELAPPRNYPPRRPACRPTPG